MDEVGQVLITCFVMTEGWVIFEPVTLVNGVEVLVSVVARVEADEKTPILHSSGVVFHSGLDVDLDEGPFCYNGARDTV